MPAYSFKQQFVSMVKRGTKRQTIRSRRKKGFAKQGDTLYLYFGLRTKWCTKIKEAKCLQVGTVLITGNDEIFVWPTRLPDQSVQIIMSTLGNRWPVGNGYIVISKSQLDAFAWADGFRPKGSTKDNPKGSYDFMMKFWKKTHELPFIGDIIYW